MTVQLTKRAALALFLTLSVFRPGAAQSTDPAVVALTPAQAYRGDPGLTIVVSGRNFERGAVVLWNDTPLTTNYANVSQLSAAVPAVLLTAAGDFNVSVVSPGGTRSNLVVFQVLRPVAIGSPRLPTGMVGTRYSGVLEAAGGLPPYTWTATGRLPDGVFLTTAGELSGVPTTEGTFTFGVRVTDAAERMAERFVTVTIGPQTLTISNASLPVAVVGREYSVTLAAENGTPPYTWSLVSAAPFGISLGRNTGVLGGIANLTGTYNLQILVSDSGGLRATKTLTLLVQNAPLVITTVAPLFNGTVGVPYTLTFGAAGGVPPYRWSVAGAVPGLQIDPDTGVFAGLPQTAGEYPITVELVDSANTRTVKPFTLTVGRQGLNILTNSLPGGTVGTPYSVRLGVTGGTPPYTWSLTSGSIPGVRFDPASGAFDSVPSTAGTYSITVEVKDSEDAGASKTFTVTIAPPNLRIAPRAEPFRADLLSEFTGAVSASGGQPPYTWSANGLPEGVRMEASTGRISGAPSAPGNFLFTARVTDAARASATELFQIAVAFPPLPALVPSGLPANGGAASQHSVRVALENPYLVSLNGELVLAFAPEAGIRDDTVLFSTGGRTVPFTIPAGSTEAQFAAGAPQFQTGTVAGTVLLSARLLASGLDVAGGPVPVHSMKIERAAPSIASARFARTAEGIEVRVTGYCTAREITQAVFRFSVSAGAGPQTVEVTTPVEEIFANWFSNPAAAQFGSQFEFRQLFTIQGDASLVTPVGVTLRNRLGATSAEVRPE